MTCRALILGAMEAVSIAGAGISAWGFWQYLARSLTLSEFLLIVLTCLSLIQTLRNYFGSEEGRR